MTLQIREKLTYSGVYELFDEPLRSYLYEHHIECPSRTQTFLERIAGEAM